MLLNLNEKQRDSIFKLIENLLQSYSEVQCRSLSNVGERENLSELSEKMCQNFSAKNSMYKRLNDARNNSLFVPVAQKTAGVKWNYKLDPTKEIPNHYLEQNTFHYVPIEDTLHSLFNRPEYENEYLAYNLNNKHQCTDGIYQDYCCAQNAKKCDLLADPTTIQIELGIDDFEVCSPLKTKATTHNVTAVYFRIRNLPAEYNSRLEHIHLVCLSKVQDFKKSASFDDVIKLIVKEIEKLRNVGINVGSMIFKGTLINISADNLGANGLFGLIKCFSADGFCRICTCTKRGSEIQVKEIAEIMRSAETYMEYVENARREEKPCNGIVNYCLFNDLEYFHIFENYSIDIMHDICEGVIHVFLKLFFDSLIKKNILKSNDIIRMVRDYNYGILSQRNKPSKVILMKRNFNQNATQAWTLLLNLPFIFYETKQHMKDAWILLSYLLQIMQIIFSSKITENDLARLSNLITNFLSGLVEQHVSLTPKLHHLNHYVTVIRKMGL